MRVSALVLPVLASLLVSAQGHAAAPRDAASFRSIELRGGGTVTVRHGPERRVTVLSGNPDRDIRSEAGRLVIEPCRGGCPGGHRIELEIVTPEVAELAVTDGGTIQLAGGFPAQDSVAASVSDGGTIDMRSLEAGSVSAAVSQGGRIFTHARRQLAASISDGGLITYWGTSEVSSSVRRGGAVVRGAAAELRGPLSRFDPTLPRLPVLARPATPRPPPGPPRNR